RCDRVVHEAADFVGKSFSANRLQSHRRIRNRHRRSFSDYLTCECHALRCRRIRCARRNLSAEHTSGGRDEQQERKRRLHYICQSVVNTPRTTFRAGAGHIMMYLRGMSNSQSKPFDTTRCLKAYLPKVYSLTLVTVARAVAHDTLSNCNSRSCSDSRVRPDPTHECRKHNTRR